MIFMQRPLLPKAAALLPYLERIDGNRWYSNAGPLLHEYEARIGELLNCHVAATSSCTSGMTAALLAMRPCKIITLPAWTFVATPNAALAAGISPYFIDVQEQTWSSYGTYVAGTANFQPGIGVSVFGAPVKYAETEHPFIIDAAGAFDAYASGLSKVGYTPVVISTHATKTFSTGEGGLVLSTDSNFILNVKEIINHGLLEGRNVYTAGINGKMSEYAAAVGLASLDEWPLARSRWLATKIRYMAEFGEWGPDFGAPNPIFDTSWVGSTFGIDIRRGVDLVAGKLAAGGISSRRVWGRGCHRYGAYRNAPCAALPVTERLSDEVLFLPFHPDMPAETIKSMASAVREALQ